MTMHDEPRMTPAAENTELAPPTTFSVLTATYNAVAVLPRLIDSLEAQTDQDFEWIVADGGSTDGTLELLEAAKGRLNLKIDSRPDFGIYDALNRAVKTASGDYYLVMGADDELFPDAVANYKRACHESGADLVTAPFEVNGQLHTARRRGWGWLYGMSAYVSGHAVGLAIRRVLHRKIGLYSNKYPITADQLFVLSVIKANHSLYTADFIAGVFSKDGLSGSDSLGSVLELFRIQIQLGHSYILQLIALILRLIRHSRAFRRTIV